MSEQQGDRLRDLEEQFSGYHIYDQHYHKVGKVDDLFVDEDDQPEYFGMKTGLFGGKSILIPMDILRVNDVRELVEVHADKAQIENAPTFNNDNELTPEYEQRVRSHFGLREREPRGERGGYFSFDFIGERGPEPETPPQQEGPRGFDKGERGVDTEYGERRESQEQRHPEEPPSEEPPSEEERPPDTPSAGPDTQRDAEAEKPARSRADGREPGRTRVRVLKRGRPGE